MSGLTGRRGRPRRWTFPWQLDLPEGKTPSAYTYPIRVSPQAVRKILEDVQGGGTLATAAASVGRSERWLTRIFEQYPQIQLAVQNARLVADGEVQKRVFESTKIPGRDGATDRIWWMKNRQQWTDRATISASVDVNIVATLTAQANNPQVLEGVRLELEEGRDKFQKLLADRHRSGLSQDVRTIDVQPPEPVA